MVNKSTVGPKGQITIPKELRERYHFLEGEEVILEASFEGILVRHRPSNLRGSLRGKLDLKGFEQDLREIRKHWKLWF